MNRISHGSHWGAFDALVEDGRIVGVEPAARDTNPSPILRGMPEAVYHKCRVARPSIRKSWLTHGFMAGGAGRGVEPFVEVPWDEAIDIVSSELRRVKGEHGNTAIFAGSYGWASAGRFHHAKTQLQRFMNCFGGYTGQKHSYSLAAGLAILPHILGDHRTLRSPSSWADIEAKTKIFIAFGGCGTKNAQVEPGGCGEHTAGPWLKRLAEAGVEIISVTPVRDDTPAFTGAQWLPIRPNTDVALMMGLAHTLIDEELHAPLFLARYTVGFEKFADYLMGRPDGIPKSADWAAAITGIDAEIIRSLARRMAQHRTMLATSYSLQRGDHGEQTFWMTAVLAAILGQIGLPGGGFGFGYGSMHGQGNPVTVYSAPALSAGSNPTGSFIPVARITDLLLHPGETYPFDGEDRVYPDTRLIYWCGGNPFHHHQDLNRLIDAWRRPETIIVNEPWWTPTARFADIVLPATTTLERNDIGASSRDRFVIAMKQAIAPVGDARNDFDIFRAFARDLGFEQQFTEGREEMDWLRHIYEVARQDAARVGVELPNFDVFWQQGYAESPVPETPHTVLAEFRAAPDANPLKTPSGKIEIFCEEIAGFGYDDCPGHPVWLEPLEWLGSPKAQKYPLHMISNQPAGKLHAQMDFAGESAALKIDGREPALIHPDDAAKRGIAERDVVRVFNDRGATLATAVVTDGVMPGVIRLATGAWYDPAQPAATGSIDKHGNPNMLTPDKGTSKLGQGPIAHTALVDVARYDGDPGTITAFEPPQFVARD
ncbi:MAG: molybdopterin guanine dinucleotide-containing S/N-oxide reductase [Hyphomicrobiaceae bacterium]|nr:molybdopterin guanine dinucleotide-containing S/N-oxide reductase [Hyphomicrobiaceae bacterium]